MNKIIHRLAGAGAVVLAASTLLIAAPTASGADTPSHPPAEEDLGVARSPEVLQAQAAGSDHHLVLLNDQIAARAAASADDRLPPCGYDPAIQCPV